MVVVVEEEEEEEEERSDVLEEAWSCLRSSAVVFFVE